VKAHANVTDEIIERYIRRELDPEGRRNFEEHLLDCSECFDEVQNLERFVAGVRHASRTGMLSPSASRSTSRWLVPALAFGLAASVTIAVIWIGTLRNLLNDSLHARDALARQLAELKTPLAGASGTQPAELTAANLPVAVLTATRAANGESVLRVPGSARQVALWMDVEPNSRYQTFTLELLTDSGRLIEMLAGLTRNSEGAVAVVLPAAHVPPGRYKVQLSSATPPRLLAEYSLRIAVE